MKHIGIIGAGTSGLFAAALLQKGGFDVTVVEKLGRIGGRSPTRWKEGFCLDSGPHLLRGAGKGLIAETLGGLGITIELADVDHPEVLFYEDGKIHEFPSSVGRISQCNFMTEQDKNGVFALFGDVEDTIESNLDRSLSEWIRSAGGGAGLSKFAQIASLGIVCPFLDRASAGELFDFIASKRIKGRTGSAYPVGGYGAVHDLLADFIRANGGTILLDAPVNGIRVSGGRAIGIALQAGVRDFDAVVCSLPACEVPSLLESGTMAQAVTERLQRIRTTAGVSIEFALADKVTDLKQCIVCAGDPLLYGFSPSNIWKKAAPEGRQLISFGAIADPTRPLDSARRDALFDAIRRSLEDIFHGFSKKVLWERPMTYPVIDGVELSTDQHRRLRPCARDAGIDGLYLCGDYLGVPGSGGDLAVASPVACARDVIEDLA